MKKRVANKRKNEVVTTAISLLYRRNKRHHFPTVSVFPSKGVTTIFPVLEGGPKKALNVVIDRLIDELNAGRP